MPRWAVRSNAPARQIGRFGALRRSVSAARAPISDIRRMSSLTCFAASSTVYSVRNYSPVLVATVAVATAAVLVGTAQAAAPSPTAAQTPRQRAQAIVAKMTLDEKIGQLHGIK